MVTDPETAKKSLSPMERFFFGFGVLLLLVILGVAWLFWSFKIEKKKYDPLVETFTGSLMPALATWDPEALDAYTAPEVLAQADPSEKRRIFAEASELGDLKSYEKPVIRRIGNLSNFPYASLITYQVPAHFVNGNAMVTMDLVPTDDNRLLIWSITLAWQTFLPPDNQEPRTATP